MYFYRDTTQIFEYIDRARSRSAFILLRPPRFGKSLLLSTMELFYDLKSSEFYESNFMVGLFPEILK